MLIKVLTSVPKTTDMRARQLLRQAYENTFGIHDYIEQAITEKSILDPDKKRPLSAVEMHKAIDPSVGSKLYLNIKLFADLDIAKYYNISLEQYLNLPHDIATFIRKDCSERRKKRHQAEDEVLSELTNKP